MEEYLDVVDENGIEKGVQKLRSEVHKDGDWHKTVHIWIVNDKNEILLQRRCASKDSFSNMLDISCGGHVSSGDTIVEAAIREFKEELGIDIVESDLKYIGTIKHTINYGKSFINNQFESIFILNKSIDIKNVKFQVNEISEIVYVPLEKFKKMILKKDKELIYREEEFGILLDYLEGKNESFDN